MRRRTISRAVSETNDASPPAGARVAPSLVKLDALLFLLLWLTYGAAINSHNLSEFNLQQIGVEAIVERGHFYLEGSRAPELYPRADVFLHDGHKYAAKQPGQFMAGALCYFFLRPLGFDYVGNYLLTSALVTLLTSALLTATAAVAVFRLARELSADESRLFWPLASALSYGPATTALAYTGIAHHDAIASAYLFFAFYLIFRLSRTRADRRRAPLLSLGAGLFLGLTLTTSMLPFLSAFVAGLYFVSLRRWRLLPHFSLGVVLGLLPLFVYDAVSFGNPFLLPNVAGNYTDTFLYLDLENFTRKLRFYASMLALYAPTFALGLLGLAFYPREFRRAQVFLACMIFALAAYVTNIGTNGDCQYGPRYLLPAMPFACLGIVGFGYLRMRLRMAAAVAVVAVGGLSFFINLVGALHGAMYCAIERHALPSYLEAMGRGEWRAFPLAPWLLAPLALVAFLFARAVWATRLAPARRASTPTP